MKACLAARLRLNDRICDKRTTRELRAAAKEIETLNDDRRQLKEQIEAIGRELAQFKKLMGVTMELSDELASAKRVAREMCAFVETTNREVAIDWLKRWPFLVK